MNRQKKSLEHFKTRLEALRHGDPGALLPLANVYLALYSNLGVEKIPAHERIGTWLSTEIDAAAKSGFEDFLIQADFHPTADEIAASAAKGKYSPIASIIVVALVERLRNDVGFGDLDNDRIMAGLFELRRGQVDRHARDPASHSRAGNNNPQPRCMEIRHEADQEPTIIGSGVSTELVAIHTTPILFLMGTVFA